MEDQPETMSFGRRLAELAAAEPDHPAVVLVTTSDEDVTLTRGELDRWATQLARLLDARGVGAGDTVALALGNSLEQVALAFAVWRVGGCVLPLSPRVVTHERDQLLELAGVRLAVADWDEAAAPVLRPSELKAAEDQPAAPPPPDVVSQPGKAIGTGGSTGRPKVIVIPGPWVHFDIDPTGTLFGQLGFRPGQRQLVAGPLYHGFGFDWLFRGIVWEHTVVLLERFDAERAVSAIERHRIQYAGLVPTMMRRILRLPDVAERDLSSLEAIVHTAAPCPPAVKRGWIDLIGAERVYEGYGGAEGFGNTVIRGDEWLDHPGSIGRPVGTEVRILDEDGGELPPGEVGGIYVRRPGVEVRNPYVGAPAPDVTPDGFTTFGDLGWVDEDGYVYVADRRTDMIVSGGVNVYPAEVEAALLEHPAVADAVVVGLPDEEWGRRVHAVYAVADGRPAPDVDDLREHCGRRLASPKVPKGWERVDHVPRDAAGKIRRSAIAAERGA